MRYIIILLILCSCSSDFDFPTECEQQNISLERQRRILYQEAEIRCESNGCTPEELESTKEEIDEHIDKQLCDGT